MTDAACEWMASRALAVQSPCLSGALSGPLPESHGSFQP